MWSHSYDNLVISDYMLFLESLQAIGLATEFQRCITDGKYVWNTQPLRITTTNHPLVMGGNVGTLVVEGSKEDIQHFNSVLSNYAYITEKYIKPEQVKLDVEYHKELNPALWLKNKTLKPEIKKRLLKIAQTFKEYLDVDIDIEDITITGSCANYNWNKYSDIDIHLVVDFKKAEKQHGKIITQYFDMARSQWKQIRDIVIENIPVELYIQDVAEKHDSSGIYSLSNNKWLIEPEYDHPTYDSDMVKRRVADYMNKIDKLKDCNKANVIEELFDNLRKKRKSGLSKEGEFSTDNLVFKTLRNNGYIEKLVDYKFNALDRQLSSGDDLLE